jgi:hypothetical protein
VIKQALETAALMLGTDKSRGYSLEMICADFIAGANLDGGNPEVLRHQILQLPANQDRQLFFEQVNGRAS